MSAISLLGRLARPKLRDAAGDRSGAVALIVAICAPVLFFTVGMAIDYTYASYINQRLARATDASVLAAVSQTAATAVGNYTDTFYLQYYGNNIFVENIKPLNLSNVSYSLVLATNADGSTTATGTYSYPVPTFFSTLLNRSSIPVGGSAASTVKPVTYVNYYILVDNSQSMGIGATAADMQALYDRVAAYNNGRPAQGGNPAEAGCVFGCHIKQSGQTYTNEDLAHNITANRGPFINLRIDAAVTAIQSIISTAATTTGTIKNIKFGLYTMQQNPLNGTYVQTVSTMSNNYPSLSTAANTISLGPSVGGAETDFVDELTYFSNNVLQLNGNGASATSPQNYVFIITDGVTDVAGNCVPKYGICTSVLDSSKCDQLKKKATVGVIYTTYIDIYNKNTPGQGWESLYNDLIVTQNIRGNIAPALQTCATSIDYYFEASDGPALNDAMSSLFAKTLPQTARLTQ